MMLMVSPDGVGRLSSCGRVGFSSAVREKHVAKGERETKRDGEEWGGGGGGGGGKQKLMIYSILS